MKNILIIDDTLDMVVLTAFILKKLRYGILSAANGREALYLIQDEKPDLVLLDLSLPVVDGQIICKHVKNDKKLKHIPIIIFSAFEDNIVAKKSMEIGADDYIVKPFKKEELIEKVRKFIG